MQAQCYPVTTNQSRMYGLNDDFLVKLKKEKPQFKMNTSIAQMHAHITVESVVLVQTAYRT